MSRLPIPNVDYTNKDYEAFRNFLLESLGVTMPEYTDRSQTDAGIVILELLAKGLDILSFYQDAQANEAFLVTAEQKENVLKWCRVLGYFPRNATPSKIRQVFVLSSAQPTDTVIPAGTRVKTRETVSENAVIFETVEDLVIPAGKLGDELDSNDEYLYSVEAVQGYTIQDEYLGSGSNGTPNQRFVLNYSPVIVSSIAILVNEGAGFEPWKRVDSFIDSTSVSKHYIAENSSDGRTSIVFGDGVTGKIPYRNANGIICTYRVGGGSRGNVGANKVILMDSNVANVVSTFNPETPFEEGYDEETLEEIKTNAANSYRTKWACLTEEDYGNKVVELFPEVYFAKSAKNEDEVDEIDVFVLPKGYPNSVPDDLETRIEDALEERGLIGIFANVFFPTDGADGTFVYLQFSKSVVINEGYDVNSINDGIDAYLSNFFALGKYDYGVPVSLSELEKGILENIEGIKSIRLSVRHSTQHTGGTAVIEDDVVVRPSVSQILRYDGFYTNNNITPVGGLTS